MQLVRELRRWSLCRTFLHQFRLAARREPAPVKAAASKGKGESGRGGAWQRYTLAPAKPPGLAAAKARHGQADSVTRSSAASGIPSLAVDCGWPDDMKRELTGCRTEADRRLWSERWAETLSGRAAQQKLAAARPPPHLRYG